MKYVMVDIETDGPIPGKYSLIEIGAIIIEPELKHTFHSKVRPISNEFSLEALSISHHQRQDTLLFEEPLCVFKDFNLWIKEFCKSRPIFISDNNGFDWMFVCWYFHYFLGENPFGHSSQNLGSLYKGLERNMFKNFKHLRITNHNHNSLNDAKSNAEAFLEIAKMYDLKIY